MSQRSNSAVENPTSRDTLHSLTPISSESETALTDSQQEALGWGASAGISTHQGVRVANRRRTRYHPTGSSILDPARNRDNRRDEPARNTPAGVTAPHKYIVFEKRRQTRLAGFSHHMSERHDTDDPRDSADTEPSDSSDRIPFQQAARDNTSGRPHDTGSAHTTTADTDREGTDETQRGTEPREAKPGDSNAEQFQAVAPRVGHDMKSHLNVAHARLDIARQEVNNDNLLKVATALDRMETLIEDLQGPAAGTAITDLERVLLPELVDQCWQNVATSQATLRNRSTLALPADPSSLKRVLENLFRNAIEHNDANVRVEVGDLDGTNGFYVADGGCGIPNGVRGAVFEPGVSTGHDGSGLGLSIVAQIVEAHDCHIRVIESEAGGARFEISDTEFAAV
jgi:hypothetical protein